MGDEEKEVAVKSLADDSTEDKRIQFLQEAAIMGQFKHPNVLTLHGVLTETDTVREFTSDCIYKIMHSHVIMQAQIVVEMMHSGDLCGYLLSLKPE